MKMIDYLKYCFLKVIRNKKNIFLIIILIIGYLTISVSLTYKNYLAHDIANIVNGDVGFRSLTVSPKQSKEIVDTSYKEGEDYNKIYNKILNVEHVLEILNFQYYYNGVTPLEYENGTIAFLYGSENTLPKNIIGETIKKDDTGVAICPTKFNPFGMAGEQDIKKTIAGKDLLGTPLTIEEDIYDKVDGRIKNTGKKYKKQYKVIGLYDEVTANTGYNTCYISPRDSKELYEKVRLLEDGREFSDVLVVLDSLKNVDKVRMELKKLGFEGETQSYIKTDYVDKVNNICNLVVFISCIGIFVLTLLYIKKMNLNNQKNIGIQKSLGFNKQQIQILSMFELLIISLISFIIGLIFTEVIYQIILIKFENYFFNNLNSINHSMINYYFGFIIILIFPLIINYLLVKISLKKQTISILKENKI